jgi:endonuclease/exonuclease/phosphatase (EEP) superfamily protein YafD
VRAGAARPDADPEIGPGPALAGGAQAGGVGTGMAETSGSGRPLPTAGPAASGPTGSGPAGSGPAGSGPAGSGPAGSGPAGSATAGSTTAGSTTAGSGRTGGWAGGTRPPDPLTTGSNRILVVAPPPQSEPRPTATAFLESVLPTRVVRLVRQRRARSRQGTILGVAAATLLTWSAVCFVDSGLPAVAAVAALVPAVSVLAVPVIALSAGGRHLIPLLVAVLAAVIPWLFVAEYAAADPGPAGRTATLRVLTVDSQDGKADPSQIVELAQESAADVVVITKLTTTLSHNLTKVGLADVGAAQWVEMRADADADGAGVWTRLQVTEKTRLAGLSRPAGRMVLQTEAGPLGMTVVQAAGRPLAPARTWSQDLKRLTDAPSEPARRIVVGDLNATPWSPAFRKVTATDLRDAADVHGRGLRPTWPAWSPIPLVPLDHVLVSRGIGVSAVESAVIAGTNHRALLVTLVLPRS